jgi:hypothetical protein
VHYPAGTLSPRAPRRIWLCMLPQGIYRRGAGAATDPTKGACQDCLGSLQSVCQDPMPGRSLPGSLPWRASRTIHRRRFALLRRTVQKPTSDAPYPGAEGYHGASEEAFCKARFERGH